MTEDFARSAAVIEAASGSRVDLFRPPYGDWEPALTRQFLAHAPLAHYAFPIFWTNMFREWALKSVLDLDALDARIDELRLSCHDGGGKILLLHDVYLPAVLLTAKILNALPALHYTVGDPVALAQAARRETDFYNRTPFAYYLNNLGRRARLKLGLAPGDHTNYKLDH
jgi:peptidoglycan/xylan/chitin deacetylase (PgdA/CDA1 family)